MSVPSSRALIFELVFFLLLSTCLIVGLQADENLTLVADTSCSAPVRWKPLKVCTRAGSGVRSSLVGCFRPVLPSP